MANGKYANNKGMNVKLLALVLALVLMVGSATAGTLAWLTDKTDEVVNTFTVGNIDITLEETTENYKMIPGVEVAKDPKVTVEAGSEDCWVFVKVVEIDPSTGKTFDDFITYTIDSAWTQLPDVDGVYYIEQAAIAESAADAEYKVLTDNKVKVNEDVTKEMLDALEADGATLPKLTFTAYAIQKYGFDTATDAWTELLTSLS